MKKVTEKSKKVIPFNEEKALSLLKTGNVKLGTIGKWQKDGFMPSRYFEQKEVFKLDGISILQKRLDSGKSQKEFLEDFNSKFNMKLSSVSLSNWENAKDIPQSAYQNLLRSYYSK